MKRQVPAAWLPQDEKRQKGFNLLRTEAADCLRQLAPLLGDRPACGEMRPSLIRLLLTDLRSGASGTPRSAYPVAGSGAKLAADGGAPNPCTTPAGRAVTPSMNGLQASPPDLLCACPWLLCHLQVLVHSAGMPELDQVLRLDNTSKLWGAWGWKEHGVQQCVSFLVSHVH